MHQNLARILWQLCYIKISFAVLVPKGFILIIDQGMDDCKRVNSTGRKGIEDDISVNQIDDGDWDDGLFRNVSVDNLPQERRNQQIDNQEYRSQVFDNHSGALLRNS